MSDDAKSRAEQLWLSAESLERQLTAAGNDEYGETLSLVADVVVATRELYLHLDVSS